MFFCCQLAVNYMYCRRSDRFPSTQNDRICSCHFVNGDKSQDPVLFPHNTGKAFLFPDPVEIARYDGIIIFAFVYCQKHVTTGT